MQAGFTNFALTQVATLYTAANTVIALASGEGSKLPTPATDGPYRLTWWDQTTYPDDPNSDPNREVVAVGSRSGDTLVVSRGAESAVGGGAASTKSTSGSTYRMALFVTAGLMQEIRDRLADEIAVTSAIAGFYAVGSFAIGWRVQSGQDGVTLTQSTMTVNEPILPASGAGPEVANALWHQAVPKAWVTVALSGQVLIQARYNIAAVTSLAGGQWSVTFSRPFANALYTMVGAAADDVNNIFVKGDLLSKTTAGCFVRAITDAGIQPAQTGQLMLHFFGLQ